MSEINFIPSSKTFIHCPRCGQLVDKDSLKDVSLIGNRAFTSATITCCPECFMRIITKYRYS